MYWFNMTILKYHVINWLNYTPICSVAMLVLWCALWRSTKEVNMLCPTRFVVGATENSKGGVAACAAPRLGYKQNQKATYIVALT